MKFIREAIQKVQSGTDPIKVAEALVVEGAMGDFQLLIDEVCTALETKNKAQVSFGPGQDDKIRYFVVANTILKLNAKDAKFTPIGSVRDLDNVIQRDLEKLLTIIDSVDQVELAGSVTGMDTISRRGGAEDLKNLCIKRLAQKSDVLEVFKDIFNLSKKQVEDLFGEDWESFTD